MGRAGERIATDRIHGLPRGSGLSSSAGISTISSDSKA